MEPDLINDFDITALFKMLQIACKSVVSNYYLNLMAIFVRPSNLLLYVAGSNIFGQLNFKVFITVVISCNEFVS